jgi:hypothetical protein
MRSRPLAWSIVATWTSSWFMIVFIRSLAAMVSKAKLRGDTCTIIMLRGTTETPALPESSKSASSTVMSVSGS